ncbi:hypothetical protein C8046_03820 [Serinibacter arcticus]|uniref:Uncharacterized protein n=1 Tax=Serinibacter arcticus TaxID=1655435 RepID=A0A2U1ZSH7_9MICO|nr:hypothetical protein [Serinibacter arcticus]PWD49938.1 hypothetical protein C8046_03820 [Serinibacter arcticus]
MTHSTRDFDFDRTVHTVVNHLVETFPDADPAELEREATEATAHFADKPITDFADVLAEREARAHLAAQQGPTPTD